MVPSIASKQSIDGLHCAANWSRAKNQAPYLLSLAEKHFHPSCPLSRNRITQYYSRSLPSGASQPSLRKLGSDHHGVHIGLLCRRCGLSHRIFIHNSRSLIYLAMKTMYLAIFVILFSSRTGNIFTRRYKQPKETNYRQIEKDILDEVMGPKVSVFF